MLCRLREDQWEKVLKVLVQVVGITDFISNKDIQYDYQKTKGADNYEKILSNDVIYGNVRIDVGRLRFR